MPRSGLTTGPLQPGSSQRYNRYIAFYHNHYRTLTINRLWESWLEDSFVPNHKLVFVKLFPWLEVDCTSSLSIFNAGHFASAIWGFQNFHTLPCFILQSLHGKLQQCMTSLRGCDLFMGKFCSEIEPRSKEKRHTERILPSVSHSGVFRRGPTPSSSSSLSGTTLSHRSYSSGNQSFWRRLRVWESHCVLACRR